MRVKILQSNSVPLQYWPVFFFEKKKALELCKILPKYNPDEIKTGEFEFREYEVQNAYTHLSYYFLYLLRYILSLV